MDKFKPTPEELVVDKAKAQSMAEAEKPFRNQILEIKNTEATREPSLLKRITGIGAKRYIDETREQDEREIEKKNELEMQAEAAANSAAAEYEDSERT